MGFAEAPQALSSLELMWGTIEPTLVNVVAIWAVGLFIGVLLPRPRWTQSVFSALLFRRLALLLHAGIIVREVWKHFTHPGTFRGLVRAIAAWSSGRGWSWSWPASATHEAPAAVRPAEPEEKEAVAAQAATSSDNWYVTEKDLAFFKYHAEESGQLEGATEWELMMHKDIPGFIRYTAWRRVLPSGRTEYKSITYAPDATAEEFMDMYLDDSFRRNWDGMVIHYEVLEHGDFAQRQQVVRWVRRFPFAFLSDREYTIARRMVKGEDGALYGLTKALADHPREYPDSSVVKMQTFWSMWRSKTVADPWGGDRPACETLLLHHEDFKIPERLARFAVRHGMWGFVRGLGTTTPKFVAARREKGVEPHRHDADAYGAGCAPNPPALSHGYASSTSLATSGSLSASEADSSCGEDAWQPEGRCGGSGSVYRPRKRRAGKALAVVALASGALLVGKALGGVAPASNAAGGSAQRRQRPQALKSHAIDAIDE